MNSYLKKDLNLFASVGKERGVGAVDFERSIKKSLLVFAAIFCVCLIACLGVNGLRQMKINRLNAAMEELKPQLAEIDGYKAEAEGLQNDIDSFKTAIAQFEVSPRLTITDIETVAKCMPSGVVLSEFSYSGSTISMSVTGNSELSIADFANSLRNSQYFKSVEYTGVSKNESIYTGSITIELKDIVAETTTETVETTTVAQ